jgi:hypothetical protein
MTAAKKPSQAFHPTPVLSAILNILFIVPLSLCLVPSKLSFIFSANAVESRISSPIAIVRSFSLFTFPLIPCSSSSFCDSSSESTASLYWPLELGVADRKWLAGEEAAPG